MLPTQSSPKLFCQGDKELGIEKSSQREGLGLAFKIKRGNDQLYIFAEKGTKEEYFNHTYPPFGREIGSLWYIAVPTMGYLEHINLLDTLINQGMAYEGMILDLRRNGGGSSTVGDYVISRFGLTRQFSFAIADGKTGKVKQYIGPVAPRGTQYKGKVALLVDHYVFSAANHFAALCHYSNKIGARKHDFIIIGGKTGGGSAIPKVTDITPEISLRLSGDVIVNPDKKHYERGI